jgi:hypothetical protein
MVSRAWHSTCLDDSFWHSVYERHMGDSTHNRKCSLLPLKAFAWSESVLTLRRSQARLEGVVQIYLQRSSTLPGHVQRSSVEEERALSVEVLLLAVQEGPRQARRQDNPFA